MGTNSNSADRRCTIRKQISVSSHEQCDVQRQVIPVDVRNVWRNVRSTLSGTNNGQAYVWPELARNS